jgi:hypothetical protein
MSIFFCVTLNNRSTTYERDLRLPVTVLIQALLLTLLFLIGTRDMRVKGFVLRSHPYMSYYSEYCSQAY